MQCSVAPPPPPQKKSVYAHSSPPRVCVTTDNAGGDLGVRAFAQLSLKSR